jgi:hypothetical protein
MMTHTPLQSLINDNTWRLFVEHIPILLTITQYFVQLSIDHERRDTHLTNMFFSAAINRLLFFLPTI